MVRIHQLNDAEICPRIKSRFFERGMRSLEMRSAESGMARANASETFRTPRLSCRAMTKQVKLAIVDRPVY